MTRDGRGIKILSTEVGKSAILRGTVAGKEGTFGWYVDGKWSASGEHELDLFMEGEADTKRSKYHRQVAPGVWIDVYDLLDAWDIRNPGVQHALKKLLQPGNRGDNNKDLIQDLKEAIWSIERGIQIEEKKQ